MEKTLLVSQISSILLQRHNWVSLLQNLNLSSKLNPPLFLQILNKTRHNPQVSLGFFNWAVTNLGFNPDLQSHCRIFQIAGVSGVSRFFKPVFESLVQTHPASLVAESMIQASEGTESECSLLSLVMECYAHKGLFFEALEVSRRMKMYKIFPSISACNSLLDALLNGNEIRLAWCFYGVMIRDGVLADGFTWSLVSQILCKDGKMERIVRLLDMGVYNLVIYNFVIDYYSKIGDFTSAISRVNEMSDRELDPGFDTYSSILDGACKLKDAEMIEMVWGVMVEKELLSESLLSENNTLIQKLCALGKTYAAEMVFQRASNKNVKLKDSTYGCMLMALTKGESIEEAIRVYGTICRNGIAVSDGCYDALANALCRENQSEVECRLLSDLIRRGFSPHASKLSKLVALQCRRGRWREMEDLLTIIIDIGSLPDSFSCSSLVEHYCSNGQVDKAIELHNKMENLKGSLDVTIYNLLLDTLFRGGRVEDAIRVFNYMKGLNLFNNTSFTIMISELCNVKELQKAMKAHDDMLKMKMKPDEATYKRLISGFK